MRKIKSYLVVAVLTMTGLPLALGNSASAWGPVRETYTNKHPADHATFNSITDNAAIGDERDFVRIEEKSSGRPYASELILEPGKQYEVYIYYHNDASETYNDEDHNLAGVARDVRLSSSFPASLKKHERAAVTGKITSSNAVPSAVWDEAYVTAKEAITLHYVIGSAKIYNQWGVNGSVLSTNLFSNQGTFLGLNALNGVILGCDKYSGQVVYTIQTKAVEPDKLEPEEPKPEEPVDPVEPDPDEPEPEAPTNPVTPTEPEEVPKELPSTGPAEIMLAVVVVLAIVAGGVYWWKTHKAVKKATKRAKGKK